MTAQSWFRTLFARKPHTVRKDRIPIRPRLEELESRLVPAFMLGTTALIEGPASGADSDIVTGSGAWTATSNASWLHTTSSGTGNGRASFSFDANAGATRSGTLTIAGQTLTVTQAGSTYVAANPIPLVSSGLSYPQDVAVDGSGNVYIADYGNGSIKKWTASTQQVSTLVSPGLNNVLGVAVDAAGNVYIANIGNNSIQEYSASTHTLSTLVSSGLNKPSAVAVDASGNIYIADTNNNAIKEYNASTHTVSTLVSSGLSAPEGVAVDSAGNVYIADTYNNAIKEYSASIHTVSTLVSSGLYNPQGVGVDGSGNVYIADFGNSAIKEWNASTQQVGTLVSSGLNTPVGVAVDASGNVFIDDTYNQALKELPRGFVPTAASEGSTAGSDHLSLVFPTTQSLTGIFAPSSDESWLTLGSAAAGVVNFSFTADTNSGVRTALLTLLGQRISLTQSGPAGLGTYTLLEGSGAGSDADVVNIPGAWSATANASWLHSTASGTGNGLVSFSFDANTGATRTGTLTIGGQTLTVTQAGSTYVAANPITLVSSQVQFGVAVDRSGDVYFADVANSAIKEWNASTQQVTTLVSSGLLSPEGVAVDNSGNVYIADYGNNAVKKYNASTQTVSTLVSGLSGLSVAVDSAGNVYIADTNNNAIREYTSTQQVITLVSSGLSGPEGVAVDSAGNVYIADTNNNAIREYHASTQQVTTLISSGLSGPEGVTLDGSGNVYIADTNNNAIKEWTASTQAVATLVSSGLSLPTGMAVSSTGNLYFADNANNAVKELPRVFVPDGVVSEGAAAASDQLLPVLPTTQSLTGIFAPISDASWLTLGGVSGAAVNFSVTANAGFVRTGNITLLGQQIPVRQYGSRILYSSTALEGPGAGSDAVLVSAASWSATANASWLHSTASGTVNGLVSFSFDANTGATRTGTLTIGGQTLTVTQAGSTYVAANPITLVSSGLNLPHGMAVSGKGNVYIADSGNNAIKEWNASTQQLTTLLSSGLNEPAAVAVDGSGNVYIADTNNNAIKEWNASTQQVTTLVASGLYFPTGVAVDGSGNIYIADSGNNAIKEYNAFTRQVTTLVSSGLNQPSGVAVDGSGNVYFADSRNNAIKKWSSSTQQVTTLISSGLYDPQDVVVDGSGNVYIADPGHYVLKEWNALTQQVTTLISSGLTLPIGVAVDGSGDVYVADSYDSAIQELPRAFVPGDAVEGMAAASDHLPPVLPTTQSLTGVFAPSSDQSWLTLGSIANGVINFSVAVNTTGAARTAHINVLGQQVAVTQAMPPTVTSPTVTNLTITTATLGGTATTDGGASVTNRGIVYALTSANPNPQIGSKGVTEVDDASDGTGAFSEAVTGLSPGVSYSFVAFATNGGGTAYGPVATFRTPPVLPTTALLEGPSTGNDAAPVNFVGAWSATTNASWLHSTAGGTGNGLASFSFDANPGATRSGTLTIAGQTLTVTQAGSTYVAANPLSTLVSSGLNRPESVAVDGSGNVYFIDSGNSAIKEWKASTQQVATLVSTGLNSPEGVAVDGSGNVYIADTSNNAIKEYNASTQQVTTLVSSGLDNPYGVAVDNLGNVYIADTYNNAIKEYNVSTQQVTTLVSGLNQPSSVAVDGSGNVYIAETYNNDIKEYNVSTQQITTLVSSGLHYPEEVAIDPSGNVYIADSSNSAIKEWNASTQQVTTLISSGLYVVSGVAVDGSGDVYIADYGNNAIKEVPRAFVPATVGAGATAGSGQLSLLPTTQSLTGIFAPSSDQSWLTLGSVANGVINFSFTANTTGVARTAHISVLGQPIAVTQAAPPVPGLSGYTSGLATQTLTYVLTATSPGIINPPGFSYSINWGDGSPVQTLSATPDNGSGVSVTHAFVNPGTYSVALTATDAYGSSTTVTTTVTALAVTSANLQTVLNNQQGLVTFQESTDPLAQTLVTAVNGLAAQTRQATITLNLGTVNYTDLTPSPKAGTTLIIQGGSGVSGVTITQGGSGYTSAPTVTFSAPQQAGGTTATATATIAGGGVTSVTITNPGSGYTTAPTVTFSAPPTGTTAAGTANLVTTTVVGHSPALQVSGGDVIVSDLTLITNTNSPTLQVNGGTLKLRNVDIEGSSTGSQATVQITGGNVNLGDGDEPGTNTFDVHNSGDLIDDAGGGDVEAVGNTFEVNETVLTSPYSIMDRISDGLNGSGGGLVSLFDGQVFVPIGGSIQNAVDAISPGGTVNVEEVDHCPQFKDYTVGSKPLTVSFQDGPTLTLDASSNLRVTGTADTQHIRFEAGKPAGTVEVEIDNYPEGSFSPTGEIIAHGGVGSDGVHIKVDNKITLPALLFADGTNAHLKAGGGPTVEVGGGGDHTRLVGGRGPNILIAGPGKANLEGRGGSDLLIGGTTAFDDNEVALAAILAEWSSARDYATRIADLSGLGSGPRDNGDYFLVAGATVFDNGASDKLKGGSGLDWYFAKRSGKDRDVIDGLRDSEIVEDLQS